MVKWCIGKHIKTRLQAGGPGSILGLGGALQQPPHLLSKNASNRNAHARHAATALSLRAPRGGSVGEGRLPPSSNVPDSITPGSSTANNAALPLKPSETRLVDSSVDKVNIEGPKIISS
uniref:Uncharacterized protein n=1 Tax=Romanomermis culicivorax TaxID=13658 RepID=A0A915HRI2_ROMCU